MKLAFTCLILMVASHNGYSQTLAAKQKVAGDKNPKHQRVLVIIKTSSNNFLADTVIYSEGLIKRIDPLWIDSVSIVKPAKTNRNVAIRKNGAMVITLNDKRYPNAFKIVDMYIKARK
jgi:hypothetical protein